MNTKRPESTVTVGTVLTVLLTVLCAYFAIAGWFNPMRFTVLAGDDLRSFSAAQSGFRTLSALFASIYRFRPVVAATILGVVSLSNQTRNRG